MNIATIIPAAGGSTRFGGDKLSQDLHGRPLLLRTVEVFSKRSEVSTIIVAGPPNGDDFEAFRERYGATLSFHGASIVKGGETERWQSVRNALAAIDDDLITHIAVHDAARPAIDDRLLDRLFEAAQQCPAVIPVVPISATIKRITPEAVALTSSEDDLIADAILGGGTGRTDLSTREVIETIDRTDLVAVQTPQVFEIDLLRRAYTGDNFGGVTDDAMLVERMGETVHTIMGDPRNIKVTTPEDLELIRAIVR